MDDTDTTQATTARHTVSSAFEPAKYLTKVQGRDYLEVRWRLVWLRNAVPDATIVTELVQHQNHNAVFRATVTLPVRWEYLDTATGEVKAASGGSATGWGSEASDDFGDYLEKAETKALGRALAALGFGTQFVHDYDFGADQNRVVDSPVGVRTSHAPRSSGHSDPAPQYATPRQIKYLWAVSREMGMTREQVQARCSAAFGHDDIDTLTRRNASALIEQIQSERNVPGLAS